MAEAIAAEPSRIRSRTFATLADNAEYRRFYVGQGISLVGTWLQDAAVGWIVYDMTHSERMLGIVSASGVMPGLLVGLFAGALADRVAPKRLILAMQVGQMLLAFALSALVALGVVTIWEMALILALTRICLTFEMPSRQVFLYELVGRSSLMNAIALNSGLFNASRVLGPALAGFCLAHFGRTACFGLNGASYLAAIVALLSIPTPRRPPPPRHEPPLKELLGGLDYLRRDRRVASLFALLAFFGVVGMGYSALVPAYARVVVRTGPLGYSILLASGGVGATVGALFVASLGGLRRKEWLILGGMLLFAASLAAAAALPPRARSLWPSSGPLAVASLCLTGVGFGGILFFSATQTLIQTGVPDHLRGRIMGIWMIVYSGTVPLSALWAGEVALRRGVVVVMGASAALCVVVALIALTTGILRAPSKAVADGVADLLPDDPGIA
ncbi:MAG TPA: MFS transporter [Isosphaeraceae bacterium]|jgi:MFS family permease|nr:MFS transporter [Isosphaeraceae bacterium]